MRSVLKMMFTGKDNQSYDLGRVLWAISTLTVLCLMIVANVLHGQAFDPMASAGALSALAIGHGASLRVKGDTEPEDKP